MSPEVWITEIPKSILLIIIFLDNTIFRNTEIQITGHQKYKLPIYQITNHTNIEIQKYKLQAYRKANSIYTNIIIIKIRKLNLQIYRTRNYRTRNYRNTIYRITEIHLHLYTYFFNLIFIFLFNYIIYIFSLYLYLHLHLRSFQFLLLHKHFYPILEFRYFVSQCIFWYKAKMPLKALKYLHKKIWEAKRRAAVFHFEIK